MDGMHRQAAVNALEHAIRETARDLGEQSAVFEDFARSALRGSEGRPLRTQGADGLAAAARAAFDFGRRRAPGEQLVRVESPAEFPGRTVIEILQEDRPFLVDTLRLFLRRHGLQEQLLLHPILPIGRGPDGMLDAVQEGRSAESLIRAEVFPRVERRERLAELEEDLRQVMRLVAAVTDDHRRMILAVRELEANLEFAGRHIEGGAERANKIRRFLGWVLSDHFVLMGVRRFDVLEHGEALQVAVRRGTGLGMWRDDEESRFFEPKVGGDVPGELHRQLADPRIIQISKGWTESRMHRAGRVDRILVKEHDEAGHVNGFAIVSGLYTFRALRTPGSQVPLLSERLEEILGADGVAPGSHRHKAMVTAFDSAPVEFLLGAETEDNAALIREIVDAEGAEEANVVLRSDPGARSYYAGVLLPRDRYSEDLRQQIRSFFAERLGAGYVDDRVSFMEEGPAILHFFCTTEGESGVPNAELLESEIRQLASRWEDRLLRALVREHGETGGSALAARYAEALPESLRVSTHPDDAVRDVDGLEALHLTGEPQFAFFFARDGVERSHTHARIYLNEERLLSDLLPVVDHFGLRVIDARQTRVEARDREAAVIHRLRVLPIGGEQRDLDALAPLLSDALRAALTRVVPDDELNGLVLGAGLDWRQVDLVRAYLEYFNQIQGSLTRPYVRGVLLDNPLAVRLLVRYHDARLDPKRGRDREEAEGRLRAAFQTYRDRITSLNEDRALGALYELIHATLRTSFFAPRPGGYRISFKLDPSLLSESTPPHPHRECFVHAAGVDGIHLRGGPVARGGLRWSDRLDDFRTEVLGLMRTQQLKNGLIVPVGAKGGYVLRETGLSPSEARRAADEWYRVFVAGLLDLTDDVDLDGRIVPPRDVHRRDGDDSYLVVAADKGTAHLSDAANALALARGFWLGDAFASGGSEGYDHKKYGITARGAWECVLHHFAELGVDPDRDVYTVAGIGDMSGDVFGNGLLLAQRAKLLAAFDHRHVFLDPDPDPEASWEERRRLFELPRSSWADYDPAVISEGGGVFPRGAKRIPLSAPVRDRLGMTAEFATGQEVVRAILAMPVDLLWNGGIGTYVKASTESHAEVGDRASEAVRIDATELRARVIGEGGNLGLTQAARVQAARSGVRLDTDAIHNSGGVDLSDHEVNIKILLAPLVRSGELSASARRKLLFEVADETCELVLANNRGQALALSLDELRARRDPEPFRWSIERLCESAGLTPAAVGLPSPAVVADGAEESACLTRPELAVLLGLAKLHVQAELAGSSLLEGEAGDAAYATYFPSALREHHADAAASHRLRFEITALAITNRLVDAGGATLIPTLVGVRGLPVDSVVAAILAAESVLDAPTYRARLLALRPRAGHENIYACLLDLDGAVREVARYLLAGEGEVPELAVTSRWYRAIMELREASNAILSPPEQLRSRERGAALRDAGLPDDLADVLAGVRLSDRALSLVKIVEATGQAPLVVGALYARLGDATGINWVYQQLPSADASTVWDRMVLADLRTDLLALQRELTELVLAEKPSEPATAAEKFLGERTALIERVRDLQVAAGPQPSASAMAVITQTLLGLRRR
jgi:glutamate dehydrogenase